MTPIQRAHAWRAAALAAALVLPAAEAAAHDPGLSSVDVRLSSNRISVTVSLAPADARSLAEASQRTLEAMALEGIELRVGGVRLPGTIEGTAATSEDVSAVLTFPRPPRDTLTIRSGILEQLAFGHRQLLTVHAADGVLLAQRMLDARDPEIEASLRGAGEAGSPAPQFLEMGVRHILGGYDHLLFLGALLLGLRRLADVVKTVTAFTVAHSLTLAMVVLGFARAPASIVEPMIAVSVVYVGLANLLQRQVDSRWKLTFAFGLIHGLGFAGALQEAGIGAAGTGVVLPLGAFNAGVEVGQIGIAVLLWPLIAYLHARPALRLRVVPVCSVLVAVAGSYWLWERTLQ